MKPIDRVEILIKNEGLSISAFEKKVGMSNNSIQTAIKRNSNLKDDTLNSILNVFQNVNPEWLLTGNGEMFRSEDSKIKMGPKMGPNVGPNSDKTVYESEKMAPKMAPNVAPNSESNCLSVSKEPQPYIYSGEQPDIEEDTDRRMEVILYQNELLEERERTIYALNEVINAQKDALKAQKALINEYENKLGELEPIHKPNGKTAG